MCILYFYLKVSFINISSPVHCPETRSTNLRLHCWLASILSHVCF